MKRFYYLIYSVIIGGLLSQPSFAQSSVDSLAIKETVLKYVESFYETDPEKGQESIHPLLAKRTVRSFQDGSQFLENMTYEQMANLAKVFNRNGRYNESSKRKVIILDMLTETASVKLEAEGWVDYMHLGKFEGQWKIINILWQWNR